MKGSSRKISTTHSIVCPMCEASELGPYARDLAKCGSCGAVIGGGALLILRQIIALPEGIGEHACECGHPEMRRLPDGVYWCPACGSEVLPPKPPWASWGTQCS
jgi:ribosomal protein L37AE/L43A